MSAKRKTANTIVIIPKRQQEHTYQAFEESWCILHPWCRGIYAFGCTIDWILRLSYPECTSNTRLYWAAPVVCTTVILKHESFLNISKVTKILFMTENVFTSQDMFNTPLFFLSSPKYSSFYIEVCMCLLCSMPAWWMMESITWLPGILSRVTWVYMKSLSLIPKRWICWLAWLIRLKMGKFLQWKNKDSKHLHVVCQVW